ncbi:MAG: GGDEF domain-containing protein, partial [Spirochaetales bacterium]|nr:GGDEF domain-containing protein [Spirochaetales bacterium]
REVVLERVSGREESRNVEDFFHQLRVVLADNARKCEAHRVDLHNGGNRALRSILNEMTSYVLNREMALEMITGQLKQLGIGTCAVFLYDNEIVHRINSTWVSPDKAVLALSYDADREPGSPVMPENRRCSLNGLFRHECLQKPVRQTLLVNSLFFMDAQLGLIVCDLDFADPYMYESLFIEISCALKLSDLMAMQAKNQQKLRIAMQELAEYNSKLNAISQTDELTGLLNRRGFLSLAEQNLQLALRMGKKGVLFYADLDGLKAINDRYGHKEGDSAIKLAASILKKTFRNADIIARLGGDEFVVFALDLPEGIVPEILDRLKAYTGSFNGRSGRPFEVSISVGHVTFTAEGKVDIADLLNIADTRLYEQKKGKRGRRESN